MTIKTVSSKIMTSLSSASMAEVLSDLNLFYIRQIGASLKKHVGLQDRLEREMKIRDGAIRLMGACTHESQLLEAAKTLHTSSARTFVYMAELQRMKASEVMEAIMDETGCTDESRVCKGRIAISDIRIPLVLKDVFPNSKSKDQHRYAVFCLLSLGSEVQDTELVCVDQATTDISFNDAIIFENATYDFKLQVEIYAYPMASSSVSAPTPQKLMSRLNRSIGKSEGKRIREHVKENAANKVKTGPQYEKIGSLVLTLGDVSDAVRSHDLNRTNQHHLSLPLYESIACRLVAQPKCVTDISMSGFLHMLHMVGAVPNWSYMWCEMKAGLLNGWKDPCDTNKPPQFVIDIIPKDIKINEIEKMRQKRPHSFQIRDVTDRHIFAAEDKDDMVKWIRALRQHKSDHGAWAIACSNDSTNRKPMLIVSPSPKRVPCDLMFESGIRKTLVYDQLGIDSPLKAMSEAIKRTDTLNGKNVDDNVMTSSVQSALLENQTTAPWAGFFTGLNGKPAKVTRQTDISSDLPTGRGCSNVTRRPTNLQLPRNDVKSPQKGQRSRAAHLRRQVVPPSCSEASGSDDAFLTDSDDNATRRRSPRTTALRKSPVSNAVKKKRRAPLSPWDNQSNSSFSNTPPPKPPLPKLPPKTKSSRSYQSSGKSKSTDPVLRVGACGFEKDSGELIDTCRFSQSSGYKSETESNGSRVSEKVWASKKNCVIPSFSAPLSDVTSEPHHSFKRSQSLDIEDFEKMKSSHGGSGLLAPSSGDVIYADPDECRPRTNTLPQTSPSRLKPRVTSHPVNFEPDELKKPTPTPRRSYLTAVESSKTNDVKSNVYETPFMYRHLPYDPNTNVYRQAKPPTLPPKLSKRAPKKPVELSGSPVYAKVDKEKKISDRSLKRNKEGYAKAQRAVINVCKKRMEEEESKVEEIATRV